MKKSVSLALAVLLVGGTLAAFAGGAGEKVELTGYITDEWCGAKNANPDGAACAKSCAEKGSKMAIVSDGKLYVLSDKKQALEHLGHKVVIAGTLGEDGVVQVASIKKAPEA